MSRTHIVRDREQLHVFLLRAQLRRIDEFAKSYNRTKTEIVEEALQYWINEQTRLYGEKLKEIE